MKKVVSLCLSSLLLFSCASVHYQVLSIEGGEDIKKTDNHSYYYENEDITISYDFWDKNGNPGFVFFNKTDRTIFLFMENSHYIRNGFAQDYYLNREVSFSSSSSVGVNNTVSASVYGYTDSPSSFVPSRVYSFSPYEYAASVSSGITGSVSHQNGEVITYKEKPVISIPPRSYKVVRDFFIMQNYPGLLAVNKKSPVTFGLEDTPCTFQIFVSYSFDKAGDDMKYAKNIFWVSKIENLKLISTMDMERTTTNNSSQYERSLQSLRNESSPDKFFIEQ